MVFPEIISSAVLFFFERLLDFKINVLPYENKSQFVLLAIIIFSYLTNALYSGTTVPINFIISTIKIYVVDEPFRMG